MSLHLVPITPGVANEHIAAWHRHSAPLGMARGRGIFSVGAADEEGTLVAVALAMRPVARHLDNGQTIEVVRVASDGTRNANSLLYGACARAAFALGYTRVITYTEASESGSSLHGAGWRVVAKRPATPGWSRPSRPRANPYRSVARQLWEVER